MSKVLRGGKPIQVDSPTLRDEKIAEMTDADDCTNKTLVDNFNDELDVEQSVNNPGTNPELSKNNNASDWKIVYLDDEIAKTTDHNPAIMAEVDDLPPVRNGSSPVNVEENDLSYDVTTDADPDLSYVNDVSYFSNDCVPEAGRGAPVFLKPEVEFSRDVSRSAADLEDCTKRLRALQANMESLNRVSSKKSHMTDRVRDDDRDYSFRPTRSVHRGASIDCDVEYRPKSSRAKDFALESSARMTYAPRSSGYSYRTRSPPRVSLEDALLNSEVYDKVRKRSRYSSPRDYDISGRKSLNKAGEERDYNRKPRLYSQASTVSISDDIDFESYRPPSNRYGSQFYNRDDYKDGSNRTSKYRDSETSRDGVSYYKLPTGSSDGLDNLDDDDDNDSYYDDDLYPISNFSDETTDDNGM